MSGLALQHLAATLPGGKDALFGPISLTVAPGQILSVMGPSGSGKSTLVDLIGGHLSPAFRTEGRVLLNGRDVTPVLAEERRIGILFQDAALFPHLSVGDNLAFGLDPAVRGRSARRAVIEAALAQAGLDGLYARDPATLSGGQRARAALMRTLLANPEAVLLDEPFARLDRARRADLRAFVLSHIRARGIPALLVTHDAEDAEAAGGPLLEL